MDVQARPRDVSARCPYCHDTLDGGSADQRIQCLGCGTSHHVACVAELGRCTVYGCERPFYAADVERARAGAPRSSAWLAVRGRIRERVRSFVREHARSPTSPAEVRDAYEAACVAIRSAERADDDVAATEALRAAARALETGRGLDLDWAWCSVDPDDLRARARRLDERREAARTLRGALQFVAVALVTILVVAAILCLGGLRG